MAIIPWEHRVSRPKKEKFKPRFEFLGNTHVADIMGFRTKKTSIEYGKRTQKLFDDDLTKTKKKSKKSIKSLLGSKTKSAFI